MVYNSRRRLESRGKRRSLRRGGENQREGIVATVSNKRLGGGIIRLRAIQGPAGDLAAQRRQPPRCMPPARPG